LLLIDTTGIAGWHLAYIPDAMSYVAVALGPMAFPMLLHSAAERIYVFLN